MKRDVLAHIMVAVISLVGLVNFFAQFAVPGYQTDPLVTYIFMGTAATIAGITGVLGKKNGNGKGPQ